LHNPVDKSKISLIKGYIGFVKSGVGNGSILDEYFYNRIELVMDV